MGLQAPDLGVSHVLPAWSLADEHLNTHHECDLEQEGTVAVTQAMEMGGDMTTD